MMMMIRLVESDDDDDDQRWKMMKGRKLYAFIFVYYVM